MSEIFKGIEPLVNKSKISVPYSWWAGDTASKFLSTIRDEMKIMGSKCKECNKVYVPPRKNCPTCFKETGWVDVADKGILQSYTVIRKKLASLPKDPPVVCGLIKLEGADTAIIHYLDEIDVDKIEIGMELKAKFADKRTGTMNDISYFVPIT